MSVRAKAIRVSGNGGWPCCICGKDTAKRKGALPAPLNIWLRLQFLADFKYPDPPTVGGSLCLGCAKRISSRLDAVIEQIESRYKS